MGPLNLKKILMNRKRVISLVLILKLDELIRKITIGKKAPRPRACMVPN